MGIRGRKLGIRRPAAYRVGLGGFRLGGMFLQGDPGTVPPNRFQHLENVTFFGGEIGERGGQKKLNDTPLHDPIACIASIEDLPTDPYRLYVILVGCPGFSDTVGFSVIHIDADQDPETQRLVYKANAVASLTMVEYDSSFHFGVDDALRKFVLVTSQYGEEALGIGGGDQDIAIATFTGFVIRCMAEFDGLLFLGLDNGAGASRIGTWDTLTAKYGQDAANPADLDSIDEPTCFGLWRDKLVVGFGLGTNHIRVRGVGATPGTWSTVNPSAGTLAACVAMCSYKDILYITDGDENVWSYDGTTLQIVHTVAGATISAIEEFNGLLYFGYLSALNEGILGTFDGVTWTDVHKNLTTQVATIRLPRILREYRGALWVGTDGIAVSGDVYRSPQANTAGTWLDKLPLTGGGGVREMVAF